MSLSIPGNPATGSVPAADSPPRKASFPEKIWAMLACFRSVPLAIVLLSLLALATLAGVLLPQEGVVDVAQIKQDFGPNYRMFKAMGLFHVYSSYWFLTLETLFFFSLLFGSFQWLKPAFLAATQKIFYGPEAIQASPDHFTLVSARPGESPEALSGRVMALLKQHRYQVYAESDGQSASNRALLYACKGNVTRFGPAIAHVGILMMLISSVYGAFFGFKAQKLAVPGETFSIRNAQTFIPNVDESIWQGSVPDWKVKVNDFHIEYYPEGEAPTKDVVTKQYYADLSVIGPDGRETHRETISVNHPLGVGDVTLYQASFNPTGKLFLEVNGKPLTVSVNTNFMNRPISLTELPDGRALVVFPFFVQQDPNVRRNYIVAFLKDRHGFTGARAGKMPPNLRLAEGGSGRLADVSIRFIRPEIATGLQIKKGPEVPWMYFSYLVIIAGAFLCIFSQRRIWVAVHAETDGCRVSLMYKTNKARLSFIKELHELRNALMTECGTRDPARGERAPVLEGAMIPGAAASVQV